MSKWFQAALEADAHVAQSAQPARWTELPGGLLALADGLKSNGSLDREKIKSAPQVWGHVRIFETALIEASHVAHKSAISEWYGLLTAVALRSAVGMQIYSESIDLNEGGGNLADGKFRSTLRDQQPARTLSAQADWNRIFLLMARTRSGGNVTLGMLSPTTLLMPSRSFRGDPDLPQSWLRKGIENPLAQPVCPLTHDQLAVCERFADHLISALQTLPGAETSISNKLIVLLNEYKTGLRMKGSASRVAEPVPDQNASTLAQGAPAGSILGAFNACWREGRPDRTISDCRLALPDHSSLGKVFSAALLVDKKLADTLNAPVDQVAVLGTVRLSQVLESQALTALKSEALGNSWNSSPQVGRAAAVDDISGIIVLSPEDILSEYLVPVKDLKTDSHAHPAGFGGFILPIRPVALLFGMTGYLNDRMTIRSDGDGVYVVRLTLDVERRNGTKVQHTIERKYVRPGLPRREGDGVVVRGGERGDGLMVHPASELSAWPDFKSRDWHWNYLSSRGHDAFNIRLTTGCSADILAYDLGEIETAEAKAQRLSVWGSELGPWPGVKHIDEGATGGAPWMETLDVRRPTPGSEASQDHARLQRCKFAFEAVCLSVAAREIHPDLPERVFAGIGFLPRPSQLEMSETKADVAVDFGTTNTTIYWKLANGAGEPIVFQRRLRHFNEAAKNVQIKADAMQFFPAALPSTQPFPTVVQETTFSIPETSRSELLASWGAAQEPLIWSEYAYLREDLKVLTGAIFAPNELGQPHFNLKFKATDRTPVHIENFLGHLLVLAYAELIQRGIRLGNVKWHFSYPLAVQQPKEYIETLTQPLKKIFPDADIDLVTESDAALGYFLLRNQPAAAQALARQSVYSGIILDIGGGTTDMYLYGRRPIWRQSMKLAGSDLMVRWLARHPAVLDRLGIARKDDFSSDGSGKYRPGAYGNSVFLKPENGEKFYSPRGEAAQLSQQRLDAAGAIINSVVFREAFTSRFRQVAGTEEFMRLEAGAALMLGGLLYYISLQIKAMAEESAADQDNASKIDFERVLADPELCFAGRGATYFSMKSDDPLFQKIIKSCLKTNPMSDQRSPADVQAARGPRLVFSGDPKSEAVLGMLLLGGHRFSQNMPEPNDARALGVGLEVKYADIDPDTNAPRHKSLSPTSMMNRNGATEIISEVAEVNLSEFHAFLKVLAEAGLSIDITEAAERLKQDASEQVELAMGHVGIGNQREKPNPPFIALLASTLDRLYTGDGVSYRFAR